MKRERNVGIDLLRLVLMFLICALHILGIGGALSATAVHSPSYAVLWVLEALACCAVDGFALISGYMAADKPQNYAKLVDMWFQVFFYSFLLCVLLSLMGLDGGWGWESLIRRALPLSYDRFWYFSAYFALFFAVPMIHRFVFELDEETARKALLLLFVLFSVIGSVADSFVLNGGYSPLWLMVLYGVGALAQRGRLFAGKKNPSLLVLLVLSVLATWAAVWICGQETRLAGYASPTVVISALTLVILFSRLSLRGKVIGKLSPLAFGIYLFQLNPIVWNQCLRDRFAFVGGLSPLAALAHVLCGAAALFAVGLAVEFLRSRLFRLLRVHTLSEKIVQWHAALLTKLAVLLK